MVAFKDVASILLGYIYEYTYTDMWKNKVLGVDKLGSMYKNRKVHGEEHWLFKYYKFLCFQMFEHQKILPLRF